MAKGKRRVRYRRGLRATPVVVVMVGAAASSCQSGHSRPLINGVAPVSATTTVPIVGVTPNTSGSSSP